MNRTPNILIFIVIVLFFSSCRPRFTGVYSDFRNKTKLDVREMDFDYFSAKAKFKFKDNKRDAKVKASIRIKKDSLIWVNFIVAGLSGGRGLISRDSVTLLNIFKKEYHVFYYEYLSSKLNYPITFDMIQAIILGNIPKKINSNNKISKNEDFYQILFPHDQYSIEYKVNTTTMRLNGVNISEENSNNNTQVNYSKFKLVNDYAFAYKVLINMLFEVNEDKIRTTIDIEYIKAQIEEKELKFPFHISKKYVRL